MPSFAIAFAETADDETSSSQAFDGSFAARPPRALFGAARLLSKLVRITRVANEDRADTREPNRRSSPNHCEFDYDYYVALQNRRSHQPSRLKHRDDRNVLL